MRFLGNGYANCRRDPSWLRRIGPDGAGLVLDRLRSSNKSHYGVTSTSTSPRDGSAPEMPKKIRPDANRDDPVISGSIDRGVEP